MKKEVKKEVKNEEQSIISTLYTKEQLKKFNFTPEEIEVIEEAELIRRTADLMPDTEEELDAFYAKLAATFPPSSDLKATYDKYLNLFKTDRKFVEQILAMSVLLDTVEDIPQAKTEKVTASDIKKEKVAQTTAAKKAKFAKMDSLLKELADKQ